MNLSISKDANVNYLSRIVKINNIRKHSNADRLQITSIDGANIIVGLDVQVGDIMVYCPTESCLNSDFLSKNNLYDNKDMNLDKEAKGYVNSKGRVRAIKLRGEISRAFLCSPKNLEIWINGLDLGDLESLVGTEFDTVDGILFSKKYIPLNSRKSSPRGEGKTKKKKKKFNRIIEEQFQFHVDTLQLGRNIHRLDPESYIQVTSKLHGCSSIAAYVLVKRQASLWEKIFSWIANKNKDFLTYDYVASSRTVVRDSKVENGGWYGKDIWSYSLNQVKECLNRGMTLYFEIVGYLPDTTTFIQKGYDYGYAPGSCGIYIYRITHTNTAGDVIEYSTQQMKAWCDSHGLNMVPELYYGKAKDLFPDISADDENWSNEFFKKLQTSYWMEKRDPMCNNDVPFEGVVLRVDNWKDIEVYKLKAEAFYQRETKLLDEEVADIESEN